MPQWDILEKLGGQYFLIPKKAHYDKIGMLGPATIKAWIEPYKYGTTSLAQKNYFITTLLDDSFLT